MKRRSRRGLWVALLLVVLAGVFTATAAAANSGLPGRLSGEGAPAFLPQNTNIASLAWRGEELRFVKCDPSIPAGLGIFGNTGVPSVFVPNSINFFVEDWSGDPHFQPDPVVGTFSYVNSHRQGAGLCVRGSFASNKPGLATIKLVVTDATGAKVLEHQFLAGWMAIGPSTITPASGTTVTEPAGFASTNDIGVRVTGTIPLDAEWQADWGLPATLTMPNDWPLLASKIATTSRAQRLANPSVAPAQYWDIHDSSGPAAIGGDNGNPDVHVPGFCTTRVTTTTVDQVDTCNDGSFLYFDRFSRVFGDATVRPTIGPFDPQYPENTLLSDGNLNALDAPMPPLRIDFSSVGNTGQFTITNGELKFCLYSRSQCGVGFGAAHDFYAPFYGAWIPATSRNGSAPDSSGTDGPLWQYLPNGIPASGGNNFEGYTPVQGFYLYWLWADILREAQPQDTDCILVGETVRRTNSGPQAVMVYTDEHGEAHATWTPGLNNDLFAEAGIDEDLGCDIEGMPLGGATITALARYPFQNVAQPVTIGTVNKAVQNLFSKTISCRLEGNANQSTTGNQAPPVYICTASARDIDGAGNRFNGELVCVSLEGEGGSQGPLVYPVPVGGARGQHELCLPLSGGTATTPATALFKFTSTQVGACINVHAFFAGENLFRSTSVRVGETGPTAPGRLCGGTVTPPPPTGGGGGGGGGGAGATPGVSVVSPVNSTTNITGASTTVQTGNSVQTLKATVVSVKVVKVRNGRALVVKVQSPNKKATIRIVLVGKNGKVVARAVRTIPANRAVRVQRLLVPKAVKSVHVSVLR